MKYVATIFDDSTLEAQTNAQERLVVETSPVGSENHSFDTTSSKSTRHENSTLKVNMMTTYNYFDNFFSYILDLNQI